MKATELRIGNTVDYRLQKNPITIEAKDLLEFEKKPQDVIETIFLPIPLDESCLVKFGFKKMAKGFMLNIPTGGENDNYFISMSSESGIIVNYLTNDYWSSNNIEYVHQLQNIYFALTSEELKTKP